MSASCACSSWYLAATSACCGEVRELRLELGADVAHAGEVLARVLEAQLGLAAALAVFRNARGLLEEHAQLLGLGGDDARDHALLDDRVGARAQARAEEDVLHVAAAHVLAVEVVVGVAVAREHALHADLGVAGTRAADAPEGIVEHELHGGAAHGLPLGRAVEDHVVHVLAAQLLGGRFAQHPAHGVDHVRLAAAVGTHHAHELPGDGDGGRIDEGFEAGKLDGGESQGGPLFMKHAPPGETAAGRRLSLCFGCPLFAGHFSRMGFYRNALRSQWLNRRRSSRPSPTPARGATTRSTCRSRSSRACARRPASRISRPSSSTTCPTGCASS